MGACSVTNQEGGATLLRENHGRLDSPLTLQTGGEGSLSGALSEHGSYVLTGTRILFFAAGRTVASSSRPLLAADGSAAQVTLAGGFAYVSEKSGSLESFALAGDGNLGGAATPVGGIPAGTIVGIAGADDSRRRARRASRHQFQPGGHLRRLRQRADPARPDQGSGRVLGGA